MQAGKKEFRLMNEDFGYFEVDVEGRFSKLRYEETNCANFISDIIRSEFEQCDLSILNCGTLRSNDVIEKGHFSLHELYNLLPMSDKVVLLRVSGPILL